MPYIGFITHFTHEYVYEKAIFAIRIWGNLVTNVVISMKIFLEFKALFQIFSWLGHRLNFPIVLTKISLINFFLWPSLRKLILKKT